MKPQTLNRILKHLKLEFSGWVRRPSAKDNFATGSYILFEEYMQGKGHPKSVMRACERLSVWHINLYEDQGLNDDIADLNELSRWAYYAYYALKFHFRLKSEYPNNPPVMTMYMLGPRLTSPMFINAPDKASVVLKQTLELLLDEEYSDYTRHIWFVLHLLCDWQGIKLDPNAFKYPESMEPYDQVLANWKTPDLIEVDRLVYILADFHVEQAFEGGDDDDLAEFDLQEWWVLPYEILSWLRIREWTGLENPSAFSHPLMQLTQNQLPSELKRPDMPELDRIIKKFRKEFP